MTKCIRILGHKWSKWSYEYGAPQLNDDQQMSRRAFQKRQCKSCGLTEEIWMNSCKLVEEEQEA